MAICYDERMFAHRPSDEDSGHATAHGTPRPANRTQMIPYREAREELLRVHSLAHVERVEQTASEDGLCKTEKEKSECCQALWQIHTPPWHPTWLSAPS